MDENDHDIDVELTEEDLQELDDDDRILGGADGEIFDADCLIANELSRLRPHRTIGGKNA